MRTSVDGIWKLGRLFAKKPEDNLQRPAVVRVFIHKLEIDVWKI